MKEGTGTNGDSLAERALKVVIDGKPCSGKTTIAAMVTQFLNSQDGHTLALDAKAYSLQNGFVAGLIRKFGEGNESDRNWMLGQEMRHALSYANMELQALLHGRGIDVKIMQRTAYDFLFIIEAAARERGAGAYSLSVAKPFVEAFARLSKPDIIVYLKAEQDVLLERFGSRKDGRDPVHRRMIGMDDWEHMRMLRKYVDGNFHIVDNSGKPWVAAMEVHEIIRKEISMLKERHAMKH